MDKIKQFMSELKELSEKHGVYLNNVYDERLDLVDKEGNILSDYIDVHVFVATPYVKPAPRDTNAKRLPFPEAEKMLKDLYAKDVREALEQESPLSKLFTKE